MDICNILVVEDDPDINKLLCRILEGAGYACRPAFSGSEAALWAGQYEYDLVLLDLMLPGLTGEEFIAQMRQKKTMPIIVLSAKAGLEDRVNVLRLGADEYLTKPCRGERLLARITNLLKRYEGRANLLEGDGFLLDRGTYTLYIHNTSVVLPKNQGKLLEVLLTGELTTAEQLCHALWGTTEFIDENALQVNLTRLKKTMASLGMRQKIVSVRGVGYRLEGPVAP